MWKLTQPKQLLVELVGNLQKVLAEFEMKTYIFKTGCLLQKSN